MKFSNFIKRKIFNEMAIMGDVIRQPIRLDKDDIEFLYQFPPEIWVQAIRKRYNDDLGEALIARHEKRLGSKKEIKEAAILAIRAGGKTRNGFFNKLLREYPQYFDKESIKKMKEHYGLKWKKDHKDLSDFEFEKALEGAGDAIAYYAIERIHPDAPETTNKNENEKTYYFTFGWKKVTIKAKPFINRLIHKLEKTKGEAHNKKIGLDNKEHPHGQYGYDLNNPKATVGKLTGGTDGMGFVTNDMAEEAIKDFLNDNYQHYYGKLPDVDEKVELPNGNIRSIEKEIYIPKKLGSKKHREDDTIEGEDKKIKLPSFKQKIIMNGKPIEIDMPFVMSAKYTKHVGANEGNIGKRKDRIEIDPENYKDKADEKNMNSGGSFTANKNKPYERKKSFGEAGYNEDYEKVIGVMKKDKDYPDLYEDIVNGIERAITQKTKYTKIRDHEAAIARNNMKELHDIILNKLKNNISEKKYHGTDWQANEARRNFAKNATISQLGQKIHGEETRRLRSSEKDAPKIIPTSLMTDEQKELIANLHNMLDKLSVAGPRSVTGGFAFPYLHKNLEKIMTIVTDEIQEKIDKDHIISQPANKTPELLEKIFGEKHNRKVNLVSAMKGVLEKLIFTYSSSKLSSHESEEEANKVIANQILPKKTISAMVASFAQLQIVQTAMRKEVVPIIPIPTTNFGAKQKYSKLPKDISDPYERGSSKSLSVLQSDKDWLALVFRHDFMGNDGIGIGTLLSIEKWITDQHNAGKIPNQYYAPAMAEIKHYKNIKK